jgi:cell division protein FtsB
MAAASDVRRPARRPVAVGIRWDRVSRVAMLFVLGGILILYIGPVRAYFATKHRVAAQNAIVHKLREDNQRLRERRRALSHPTTLEREARKLGMVRPGEKPFIVRHLPKGP